MANEVTAPELAQMCKDAGIAYTRQHISRLCRSGQISGAYQVGAGLRKTWVIPYDSALRFIADKKRVK